MVFFWDFPRGQKKSRSCFSALGWVAWFRLSSIPKEPPFRHALVVFSFRNLRLGRMVFWRNHPQGNYDSGVPFGRFLNNWVKQTKKQT